MTESPSLKSRASPYGWARGLGVSALTLALVASTSAPTYAAITNTATANGTPAAGTLTPPTDTENVPVAPGTPTLSVVKTAAAPVETGSDGVINGGDRIPYTFVVTNTGNVTINAVTPVEDANFPTFNSVVGTGTMGAFTLVSTTNAATSGSTLAPGESGTFTANYTLSNVDAYRAAGLLAATANAVINSAKATGTPVTGTLGPVTSATVESEIPGNPRLSINKTFAFTTDTAPLLQANVGDTITYTYTVVNTGNVAITNLTISDVHEGAALVGEPSGEALSSDGPLAPGVVSTNGTVDDGTWANIRPGATVTFTYVHTVTQAEVDGG
jgi:Domain of unknown function DUF11